VAPAHAPDIPSNAETGQELLFSPMQLAKPLEPFSRTARLGPLSSFFPFPRTRLPRLRPTSPTPPRALNRHVADGANPASVDIVGGCPPRLAARVKPWCGRSGWAFECFGNLAEAGDTASPAGHDALAPDLPLEGASQVQAPVRGWSRPVSTCRDRAPCASSKGLARCFRSSRAASSTLGRPWSLVQGHRDTSKSARPRIFNIPPRSRGEGLTHGAPDRPTVAAQQQPLVFLRHHHHRGVGELLRARMISDRQSAYSLRVPDATVLYATRHRWFALCAARRGSNQAGRGRAYCGGALGRRSRAGLIKATSSWSGPAHCLPSAIRGTRGGRRRLVERK